MTDRSVAISWMGVPCANRCRHCLLNAGGPSRVSASYERARKIAEKFLRWAQDTGGQIRVEFGVDASLEMAKAQLDDYIRLRRDHNMPGWDWLLLNGLQFRTRDELRQLFRLLRDVGIRRANLSFHGLAESHDAWASRRGDFAYLMRMAELIAECGLSRTETILITKSRLADLARLLETLDAIPGLVERHPNLIDYRGRGRTVDHERVELQDLAAIPSGLRDAIDPTRYRTEASWIQSIHAGTIPEKTERVYFLTVRDDNVQQLEDDDCAAILWSIRKEDEARWSVEPFMSELANKYGEPGSQKLYALRDLEWKWLGSRYAEYDRAFLQEWLDPLRSQVILR